MSNMSYCRFRNTLIDLQDCFEHWEELDEEDEEEMRAREELLQLCRDIVEIYGDEE